MTNWVVIAKSFANLEINWDGYGAISPIKSICESAAAFMSLLDNNLYNEITDVYPHSNGTISIEWERDIYNKMSLEIGTENYTYFLKMEGMDDVLIDRYSVIEDIDSISKNIKNLLSK